jgi:signal transduction histidine kinase
VLRDIDIDVEVTAPPMSADPDMLRVVSQNLFINSAHAMQGKGRVRVAVEPVDTTCQIAFIDAGPGIPPDIRQRISSRRRRADRVWVCPPSSDSSKRTTARSPSTCPPAG